MIIRESRNALLNRLRNREAVTNIFSRNNIQLGEAQDRSQFAGNYLIIYLDTSSEMIGRVINGVWWELNFVLRCMVTKNTDSADVIDVVVSSLYNANGTIVDSVDNPGEVSFSISPLRTQSGLLQIDINVPYRTRNVTVTNR